MRILNKNNYTSSTIEIENFNNIKISKKKISDYLFLNIFFEKIMNFYKNEDNVSLLKNQIKSLKHFTKRDFTIKNKYKMLKKNYNAISDMVNLDNFINRILQNKFKKNNFHSNIVRNHLNENNNPIEKKNLISINQFHFKILNNVEIFKIQKNLFIKKVYENLYTKIDINKNIFHIYRIDVNLNKLKEINIKFYYKNESYSSIIQEQVNFLIEKIKNLNFNIANVFLINNIQKKNQNIKFKEAFLTEYTKNQSLNDISLISKKYKMSFNKKSYAIV